MVPAPGNASRRTTPLPRNWASLRAPVLERDGHRCTWLLEEDGSRCTEHATDVDHIGSPGDHSPENLRSLCGYHHNKRTAVQARAARGPMLTRQRPAPAHPGLLGPTPTDTAGNTRPPAPPADPADDVPPY